MKQLFALILAFLLSSPCTGWCRDEMVFGKKLSDGTTVATHQTRSSEMRPSIYQVLSEKTPDTYEQRCVEEPYEVCRLDLLRTTDDGRETVWSEEKAFSKAVGPLTSGTTPLAGVIVWDVVDSDGKMFVLASVDTRIRVYLQEKNATGQWKTRAMHELGTIFSIHFSGKLDVRDDGVSVEIAQWDEERSDGDVPNPQMFWIADDGAQKCSGGECVAP